MQLCLVTDRRRLGPVLAPFETARRRLIDQVKWAIASGVGLIQVRERDLDAGPLAALVAELVQASRGTDTRIVVNERADVALACGADGVHLRHDSVPAAGLRRIVPAGFLIGKSVHTAGEALAAGPVDYLIAGTVFPTGSKPDAGPLLGLEGLAGIVRVAPVPVLAIGGVTQARLEAIEATGAAGVAAISLFLDRFDRSGTPSYH